MLDKMNAVQNFFVQVNYQAVKTYVDCLLWITNNFTRLKIADIGERKDFITKIYNFTTILIVPI